MTRAVRNVPALFRGTLVGAIVVYQRALSPFLGSNCRFYPSCSQYAKEAVLKHGVRRGLLLAAARLARCGPWHPGGVDNVP